MKEFILANATQSVEFRPTATADLFLIRMRGGPWSNRVLTVEQARRLYARLLAAGYVAW